MCDTLGGTVHCMSDNPQNDRFAWRDIPAKGLPRRSAPERVADFLEIYGPYDEQTAREQASRCIQCPNPTCVSGCPLCSPIPQWMLLTAEGKFLEAAAVLGSATNLAEICSRLCPADHLCEGSCILDSVAEPVSIRALEQFLTDYAFAHGQLEAATPPPAGRRVAVIGSGIAGLICADELSRRAYDVTIFDTELVPGGLLVNGVPAFDLDSSILQRRIDLLKRRGVKFRLGAGLWREITLGGLGREFHAVFLGLDSRKARTLQVPGADLEGVVLPVAFLLQKTTAIPSTAPEIQVRDKRVIVIGAGDTAMDCARVALRYGAASATCVYRRTEAEMPCARAAYASAIEEGVKFVFQAAPVAVLASPRGSVGRLRLARTVAAPPTGAPRLDFVPFPGSEFELDADWIIPALGFEAVPCPAAGEFDLLAHNSWGGLKVDENQMTSRPGVFAAGDLVLGPSPVLETVRDARRAAEKIAAYLAKPA